MMKLVLVGVLMVFQVSVHASSRDAVLGLWAGVSSIIEVTEGEGTLSARVIALKDPVYREGEEAGTLGAIRKDDNNPDTSLRDKTVLGLELLLSYQFEDGEWGGKIYDPESGKIYSSNMKVQDGVLMMRGYIGVKWLGRTAEFGPMQTCNEHIQSMLQASQLSGHCDL